MSHATLSREESNPALTYTGPENRGKCGFCGKPEGGYAKQDKNGVWQAACWNCIKPVPVPPQKRNPVGTTFTEDLDTDAQIRARERVKAKGIPPSEHRPRVL